MKSKFYFTFLLFLACMLLCTCKKEYSATAIILDEGNIAADGCGWMIKVNNNIYHPDNLPEQYQVNNLTVSIKYRLLNSHWSCGLTPTSAQSDSSNTIHLSSINKF